MQKRKKKDEKLSREKAKTEDTLFSVAGVVRFACDVREVTSVVQQTAWKQPLGDGCAAEGNHGRG